MQYEFESSCVDRVSPVRPVLDVSQTQDVEHLVRPPDVVHAAPALVHGGQHEHMGARALEVTCEIRSLFEI